MIASIPTTTPVNCLPISPPIQSDASIEAFASHMFSRFNSPLVIAQSPIFRVFKTALSSGETMMLSPSCVWSRMTSSTVSTPNITPTAR